jgi:diguanylate cyclase (GGDEF)-like protein
MAGGPTRPAGKRLQKRTTGFVTLPIVALAAASFGVVLVSLAIGAHETDAIALNRQRETIEHAIDQHGLSLARELRVQSVWNEGYEKSHANDTAWLHKFYGVYLSELLGYDRIYVVTSDNKPVYGYVPQIGSKTSNGFAEVAPGLQDLIRAVRNPAAVRADYNVVTTDIALGNGTVVHHHAVADVRDIGGRPATVVVSTIVPDHAPVQLTGASPYLLIAVEDLDKAFTKRLGANFGFRDMEWVTGTPPAGDVTEDVKALDGAPVGTLAWRKDRPGLEFVRRVAPGLGIALVLLIALTYALTRWGNRQAQRILQSEQQAKLAARTDPLTGLPNRVGLREGFARLLGEAAAKQSTLGVLSFDIDQFKGINDAFGHTVGDAVLLATAKRLGGLLEPGALLARPDGDCFVMLVPGLDAAGAAELAADMLTALAEPVDLNGGTRVFVTASVGSAIGPRDGDTGDDLLRRAELAVDKAKASADEAAVAFAPEMDMEITYRRTLETALRKAVADGNINVFYQPLMDPSGRRVLGVEALARWTDPMLGPVSPEIFIPLAEETGLIQNIGELVLRRAVKDGQAWRGVSVAVNVSATQIHHGDVVEVVRDVLRASRFPARRLEIEITESVLLADEKRANEQMRGLQALGVKVALDDFGTGYSSLHYLRRFGFDKLKIDRSFIDGAGAPQDSSIILASIIRLGHDLDLTITAEGVETAEQQSWLQASGCHQLQGYLFSRPLPAEQMTQFIAAHTAAAAATG